MCVVLMGCGNGDSPPPPVQQPPPASGGGWYFQYSPGMSVPNAYGNGGFSFLFPAFDGVHYLVKPQAGTLSGVIAITYSIDAPPSAIFDYRTNADNTCGPGFPGTVTPYFHMANDGAMANEFGRWFGQGYKQELAPGSFTIGAPFYSDPGRWVSVYGKNGATYLPQFQAALSSVAEVGVVFGGGCFAGHGVFVSGGQAAMVAVSFGAN